MKKLAVIILGTLTIISLTACGCGAKANDMAKTPTEQIQFDEPSNPSPECPDCPKCPDCPDGEQKPTPRIPRIRHGHRTPNPKSAHIKR